ncbi:MAG: VWA domain-containing protein, partial [Pirellulales bacterium]|nr:VWA domain-containing protein [Pirellulales bacterium]
MSLASLLPLGEGLTRTAFEWGRIQSNTDWILPVAVMIMAALFVVRMYRRDGRELTRGVRIVLTVLRTCVFLALLVLFLQPQWRTEIERLVNSRVVLLVDTSLSMGMADVGVERDNSSGGARTTRAEFVANTLDDMGFIPHVQERHDLAVYRFDENTEALATIEKHAGPLQQDKPDGEKKEKDAHTSAVKVDWHTMLAPRGAQTRLSDAIVDVIQQQREAPLSAVICISDGCQNMGSGAETAVRTALEAGVNVHTIGVGSKRLPANVRVADFIVPARAYPGDEYTVSGFVQGHRAAGKTVTVELLRRAAEDGKDSAAKTGTGELVESRKVTLGDDGEVMALKFEMTPKALGRQTLCLKVTGIPGDVDPGDNISEADIEIVERKCRVLLVAGGPSREYRFLRNMLHRDESIEVDVLLQTAQMGISQDASAVLDEFPATREEMFKYDCVVALDPDWQAFSDKQLELLENWVAEQGGGLVVAAGAVHMGNPIVSWIGDERMDVVRALYPVTFHRRFALQARSHASKDPWPLSFTNEGRQAEFLWLGDDAVTSQAAWKNFPGVYSYYPVAGAKPGATVFARFSDPAV